MQPLSGIGCAGERSRYTRLDNPTESAGQQVDSAARFLLLGVVCVLTLTSCRSASSDRSTPASTVGTAGRLGPTSTSLPPTSTVAAVAPTSTSLPLEPVGPQDWQRGPSDAGVTLLVYTDIHCFTCWQLHNDLDALMARHPEEVRLVVRLFPLIGNRELAGVAAEALLLSDESGAFWEMFDFLNETHSEWAALAPDQFVAWLSNSVAEIGLDPSSMEQALTSGRFTDEVSELYQTRLAQGIPGVPLLLINSEPFVITADPSSLEAAVRLAVLSTNQFQGEPPLVIDTAKTYRAEIEFDQGLVELQLFPAESPVAVNSFVFLARNGWYDDSPIYRSVPNVLIEAGDPSGTGFGDPGFHYDSETGSSLSFDRPGVVGMVNSGPGTNGARFFIALQSMTGIDETHTVLGRVVSGLELLIDLPPHDPFQDLLSDPPLKIREVRILESD